MNNQSDRNADVKVSLHALLVFLLGLSLASCSAAPQATAPPIGSPSEPPLGSPNGSPGASPTSPPAAGDLASIHVIVFQDLNQNAQLDTNEPGVAGEIGLAPDTDCTIGDPAVILEATTDPASGEYTFTDLTPGLYCVLFRGPQRLTTEPAVTLTLSDGARGEVAFGLQP